MHCGCHAPAHPAPPKPCCMCNKVLHRQFMVAKRDLGLGARIRTGQVPDCLTNLSTASVREWTWSFS
jgi:hypothetical protein